MVNTDYELLRDKMNTNVQTNKKKDTTVAAVISDILKKQEEIEKKNRMEDTHVRATFLIRRDLLDDLNNLCDGRRGLKTRLINSMLENLLR